MKTSASARPPDVRPAMVCHNVHRLTRPIRDEAGSQRPLHVGSRWLGGQPELTRPADVRGLEAMRISRIGKLWIDRRRRPIMERDYRTLGLRAKRSWKSCGRRGESAGTRTCIGRWACSTCMAWSMQPVIRPIEPRRLMAVERAAEPPRHDLEATTELADEGYAFTGGTRRPTGMGGDTWRAGRGGKIAAVDDLP